MPTGPRSKKPYSEASQIPSWWRVIHGAGTGQNKVVNLTRIRDDVGFEKRLIPKLTYDKVKEKASLITSSASTNGGMNDRMAIVGPKAAKCYFNLPYIKLFDRSYLDSAMINTESFFNRQYWSNNCGDRKLIGDKPRKMVNGGFID